MDLNIYGQADWFIQHFKRLYVVRDKSMPMRKVYTFTLEFEDLGPMENQPRQITYGPVEFDNVGTGLYFSYPVEFASIQETPISLMFSERTLSNMSPVEKWLELSVLYRKFNKDRDPDNSMDEILNIKLRLYENLTHYAITYTRW